jgi:hypothetical protein
MIVGLFDSRDLSSFLSGLPVDMGLFLIEPCFQGNNLCE